MRILYLTDLHGIHNKYDKSIDLAKDHKADIIVNGGDMLPQTYKSFKKDHYSAQKYFLTQYLDSYFSRLNDSGISFVGMLGNDDFSVWDSEFIKYTSKYPNIHTDLVGKCIDFKEYDFVGMNFVCDYRFQLKDRCRLDYKGWNPPVTNGYPFKTSQEGNITMFHWENTIKGYPTIEEELSYLPKPKDYRKSIFVIHDPPSNLGLDVCWTGLKVGSRSVLKFICNKQPLLTLHGHIHESPSMSGKWMNHIDNTTCIQPGQDDDLVYVIIDIDNNKIKANRYIQKTKYNINTWSSGYNIKEK